MLPASRLRIEEYLRLFLGMMACLSVLVLTQALLQSWLGKTYFEEGSFLRIFFGSVCLHGSILLGTIIYFVIYQLSWVELFGLKNGTPARVILLGLLGTLLFFPVGGFLQWASTEVLIRIHVDVKAQLAITEFLAAKSDLGRLLMTTVAVLLAPLAEELLFRGLLFQLMLQVLKRWQAYALSAALFAAIHGSLSIFLPLFVFGLLLAWLYEKSGNLLTPVVTHSLFNGVNIALLYLSSPGHSGWRHP